jgi:hypothetical protein
MKAGVLFGGEKAIVMLTSYGSLTDPSLVKKLAVKGIHTYIAFGVEMEEVKKKYGRHFDVILKDPQQSDDLRILDYNGHRAFRDFAPTRIGPSVYYEP